MALAKELLGCSVMERRSAFSSPTVRFQRHFRQRQDYSFRVNPVVAEKRRLGVRKVVASPPVPAVSEDLLTAAPEKPAAKIKVRAVVTVRNKRKEDLKDSLANYLDALADNIGRNVVLQLVSTDIDPNSQAPKKSNGAALKDWSKKMNHKAERVNYLAEFTVDSSFGKPGAITVTNKHQKEFFVESITVEGFACGPVHFACNSWVQSYKDYSRKRIFFSNQPYLQSETPAGLRALREEELEDLRGDGRGVRKLSDRIYDFDVYNDLGNPDKGIDFVRPTLGGDERPYPRRCRTGRLATLTGEPFVEGDVVEYEEKYHADWSHGKNDDENEERSLSRKSRRREKKKLKSVQYQRLNLLN